MDVADLARMTPKQHLDAAQAALTRHINACPSGEQRNALTAANIILMESQSGKRRG